MFVYESTTVNVSLEIVLACSLDGIGKMKLTTDKGYSTRNVSCKS